MGLFSTRGKNKQEADGQDSGYYSRDDQAGNERARRRLVGAIMLALLVAVGLPMLLDSEPKPLSNDIDIRIPSKDKAPEPAAAAAASSAPVAASATLDSGEEVVAEPSKLNKPAPQPVPAPLPRPAPVAIAPPPVAEVKLPS